MARCVVVFFGFQGYCIIPFFLPTECVWLEVKMKALIVGVRGVGIEVACGALFFNLFEELNGIASIEKFHVPKL